MENTNTILSAEELRQRIEDKDKGRTAELKEVATLVLNTKVAEYILHNDYEIDAGDIPMERYEVHLADILDVCHSTSKEVYPPASSNEFGVVVREIIWQLEVLGYLAVIKERARNYAKMAISLSGRT